MEVQQNKDGLHISQKKYVFDLLKQTGMESCKDAPTSMSIEVKYTKMVSDVFSDVSLYRSVIGALLYVTITRSEISFVVHKPSQFM